LFLSFRQTLVDEGILAYFYKDANSTHVQNVPLLFRMKSITCACVACRTTCTANHG
jgi:hypothetical protein